MGWVDKYDPAYTGEFYERDMAPLLDDYFRVEVGDARYLPVDRLGKEPIIFIANHSAMGMSWDNIVLDVVLYRQLKALYGNKDDALQFKVRRLVDPLLTRGKSSLNLFFIRDWWERTGCLPAGMDAFDYLMQKNTPVFISPEGTNASSKSFTKRYQLQDFSSSFVYMALKYRARVIPVTIVNAEYTRPFNFRLDPLHRLVRRFGMPMLPIGPATTQMLFPATYLTPYPVKLVYRFHEEVRFAGNVETMTRETLKAMTQEFRRSFQRQLDDSVSHHHRPYDLRGYLQAFRRAKVKKMMIPFFWHEQFLKTAGYPDWLQVLYKIPFGFPLVALAHRLLSVGRQHAPR